MSEVLNFALRNPLLMLLGGGLVGVTVFLYWLYETFRPETHVLLIGEEEKRLDTIKINKETPVTLNSYNKKQPRRFFKLYNGYVESKNGKRVINYLGKRGTAYTWRIKPFPEEPVKIGSLWDGLNAVWDAKLIEKIPSEAKAALVNSDLYVTVGVDEGLTPPGYTSITEETVISEGASIMAEEFAKAAKTANKPSFILIIMAAGAGGLVTVFILGLLNWLSIGGR